MSTFANRVALITGAGSGLGRQLALTLAAEGAAIAAIDLSAASLENLSAELSGKRSATAVADVTDLPGLRKAAVQLQEKLGPLDLLIANAGIGVETSALSFHAEDVEALVRVNLIGVSNSIDVVLPAMLARRRGHLVAISSLASFRGLPQMAGYCATKAGVNALLEGLRIELRPHGITTTIVCPGWIRTPMTDKLSLPMPDILEVADAARRIVVAIQQRRTIVAFPARTARRLGFLRLLPCGVSDWLLTQMWRKMAKR